MADDGSDVQVPREEEEEEMEEEEFSEMAMEPPISITIPPVEHVASSSVRSSVSDDDRTSSNGSATPPLSIPPSGGSSSMITTRSLGSRSSFDGFPSSNSSSISLSSDRELVHQACLVLRQVPVEVQALDLSTNTRKPRRPLKNLKALSELTNLVQLDLSGNAVERLEGLQVFTQLKTLAMPRNHLKTLSAPLFALKELTHLDLSGNFIAHLPRAFSGLTMLEELNLSGNNLGTLREVDVLASLANLLSCSLAANPFCRLPTYKDYILYKIRSLERLDDVEISRNARDRAAKRFGNAMFSQDACLREAGRVHEDEQNRLLEAQSALEAENLRLKGELQVKSKLLQNKSRAWSSATEQLLQLQQEVAMLNLDRRRSVSLADDEPSDAEQIAMAIAARHRSSNATQQRPHSDEA
ncbi:transcription initiation factor tfiid subunit [Phytophthora cinnamomi]|uniref:transcription initiation factor tfiid subunit n=1 Tax=Phytophthora cinnamomi TaxID=4785 RepID=UPI00355975FD|nr:transcription initiation factor tfiid subunit [Phytophthora cinnamomi]